MKLKSENEVIHNRSSKLQAPGAKHILHRKLVHLVQLLPLVFFAAQGQELEATSFGDVSSSSSDAEQSHSGLALPHQQAPDSEGSNTEFDTGAPLELTTDYGSFTAVKEPPTETPEQNLDGAAGLLSNRLTSEEQFNHRLGLLLSQSTADSRDKQQQLDALQEKLSGSERSQGQDLQRLGDADKKVAQERLHAEKVERQLSIAVGAMATERRTVRWLQGRMKTLVSHLKNVTRLSQTMEKKLNLANSKVASKSQEVVTLTEEAKERQRMPVKWKATLRKALADKGAEEKHLKAVEHQNFLLQQRVLAMSKRDEVLKRENFIMRKRLRGKDQEIEEQSKEIDSLKLNLVETQKGNLVLQKQNGYADSLEALTTAREAVAGVGGGASATAVADPPLGSDSLASTGDRTDDAPDETASPLLQLKSDSRGLSAVMTNGAESNAEEHSEIRSANKPGTREELGRDGQGVTTLLRGMPKTP